jgi:F0F1-type ATP synthase gamma subunit
MNYLKNIIIQIEDLTGIKDIVGASEEIASMKMRGIRNQVLLSRDLNDELTEIYREVTMSYKNQIMLLLSQKKSLDANAKRNLSLKRGNGKTACVFLSANSGFFSKILEKTYAEFVSYLEQHDVVPVIIGEFGKKLFKNQFATREFIFYPFAEDETQEENFKKITGKLAEYENVIIFYARFESMASQTVSSLDVSGLEKPVSQEPINTVHYLFEPSLEKILSFFETEIFAGIIQQTVTESELARYASRITTLDIARENINAKLKIINLQKRFASHRMLNKKQNEAMTGISLWKLA